MKWLLSAVLLLSVGCSFRAPRISDAPPKVDEGGAEKTYQKTLERFTARKEIYDGFDTRLFAATTFKSEAFRREKAKRKASFDRLPANEYEALLAEELAEANTTHEFFFGAHLNDMKYDDFDRPDSVWRVALVTPSGEVIPAQKQRLGRGDEVLRAYYPYMDTFWVGYSLRFPTVTSSGEPVIPEGTETVTLRLSSTLGQTDFIVAAK